MNQLLEPGPELDRLVAELLGIDTSDVTRPEHYFTMEDWPDYRCDYCYTLMTQQKEKPCIEKFYPDDYSTRIAAAWPVFQYVMTNAYYSRRKAFYASLQRQAALADGQSVLWPDVLTRLKDKMPYAICIAFLEIGKVYPKGFIPQELRAE